MKGRYVMLIAFLSVVINGLSLYNLLIGYISIFIMLITFIPNVFIKIIEIGKKAKAKGANHILIRAITDFEKNAFQTAPYIFGLILIYIVGGSFLVLQICHYEYIDRLVTSYVHMPIYYAVVQFLVAVEYVLFITSLITMTIHFQKLFREAPMFQKNNESRYVEMQD